MFTLYKPSRVTKCKNKLRRTYAKRNYTFDANPKWTTVQPSHQCDEVHQAGDGKVVICGWVDANRALSSSLTFLRIRDGKGSVQVLADDVDKEIVKLTQQIPLESVVMVEGSVQQRPEDQVNKDMTSGAVEIVAEKIAVLNKAENLPFMFHRDEISVNDDVALKYRYLELRKDYLQRNIRLRSNGTMEIRKLLHDSGFTEVETPVLFRSTPEGAREFLVPTRKHGMFYGLPQSPQQHKQILMASGFEKYFQIAKCFRDENGRKDRQPEFTQLDMEIAYVDREGIIGLIESILKKLWSLKDIALPDTFPRYTYKEVMTKYGSDKPDTRYDFCIQDLTKIFDNTEVGVLKPALEKKGSVVGINMKGLGSEMSNKLIKSVQSEAVAAGGKGAITIKYANGEFKSPIAKVLSEEEKANLISTLDMKEGDFVVIASGEGYEGHKVAGRIRTYLAGLMQEKGLLVLNPKQFNFLWVLDFPLFSKKDDESVVSSGADFEPEHHPFTAPIPEHVDLIEKEPLSVIGQHYDIVVNGYEIGGGSIRIHKPEVQRAVFEKVLKLSETQTESFKHLLNALSHGCPPHGGIALGLDRIFAILSGEQNIRNVIAFPKNHAGYDPMCETPNTVTKEQLEELYIEVNEKETK